MDIAAKAGFEFRKEVAGPFSLATFRSANLLGNDVLTVYIEGDGAPWSSSTHPPRDPTPLNPLGLMLASSDGHHPILYMARPCQYLDEAELASCHYKYWTTERFSPMVIEAADGIIDRAKTASRTRRIRLIGFSGGGVLAALVAARRADMDSLITVAAPLDIEAWAAFQQISPLQGSLNPMDFIGALSQIRQMHLVGEKDTIVPPAYVKKIQGRMPFATFVIVPGYTHNCCWDQDWPGLLTRKLQ